MRIMMLAQSFAPVVGGEERIVEDLSAELVAPRARSCGRDPAASPASRRRREVDGVAGPSAAQHQLPGDEARRDTERRHAPPAPDPATVRDLRRVLRRERPQSSTPTTGSSTPTCR